MRIHANSRSVDYWRGHFKSCPTVVLDGAKQTNVIVADDCEGYVEIYVCDDQGRPIFDVARERYATKLITGKVEIVGDCRLANA